MKTILCTISILCACDFALTAEKTGEKAPRQEKIVSVTPVDQLTLLPGFKAEIVYNVPKEVQGSWVSMTIDGKGRLIASDQYGALYRITPCAPWASSDKTKVEKIKLDIGWAHGLLWAYDSLFVTVADSDQKSSEKKGLARGIYRVEDTDKDDNLDKVTLIKAINGGGEHGPHGLALGPDGLLYIAIGNLTKTPVPFTASLTGKNWQEDLLLPRFWDPNGHAKGVTAPGGIVVRFDPTGKKWELVGSGYRNAYDIAFNPQGDLFSYDSDMEWDMGTPWYRPTRAVFNPMGADFGWRSGSGNSPSWYSDSLPPLVDIGPGSPVGVVFGTGAKFPAAYQRAFFMLDWTYGTIYALHLTPSGAGYTPKKEEFASGKPWPLTDAVIGRDGAMYVSVGGRVTQSGIYRITYTGRESTAPALPIPLTDKGRQRQGLEALLGRSEPNALAQAWPHIGDPDRTLRFTARLILEQQPIATWKENVLNAKRPQEIITGLTALARCGDKSLLPSAMETWLRLNLAQLYVDTQLEGLRACSLLITRLGQPEKDLAKRLVAKLDPLFPARDYRLNRDLASLLAVLESQTVIGKVLTQMSQDESAAQNLDLTRFIDQNSRYGATLAKMVASKPITQHMHYATVLSSVKVGWTTAQRQKYFGWFSAVESQAEGGKSMQKYLAAIREAAWLNVPPAERIGLAPEKSLPTGSDGNLEQLANLIQPQGPGRAWTISEAAELAEAGMMKRNYNTGKAMVHATQCLTCHRFNGVGAGIGPDLTSVGSKFSARDLLESIIEPSKVISDQYQSSTFVTHRGETIVGTEGGEEDGQILIATNIFDASQLTKIPKDQLASVTPVPVSAMPPGLINGLNANELLDMIAYLLAAGNENDHLFKQ